jgi:trehalose synthase
METIDITRFLKDISLEEQLIDTELSSSLNEIIVDVEQNMKTLKEKRLIFINSTATGGGVAEMLPRLMYLIKYFNIDVIWQVLKTNNQEFFKLTKKIHNFIHGENPSKVAVEFTEHEKKIYEEVNEINAKDFCKFLRPGDIVMIHDPQPCALIKYIRRKYTRHEVPCYWRCHIGYDKETPETKGAWAFLEEYVKMYDLCIFTAPEYVPTFAPNPRIVTPSLHPLDYKNKFLRHTEINTILKKAGIIPYNPKYFNPNDEYQYKATMYDSETKKFVIPNTSERLRNFGLTERPLIIQISRWDKLKGWSELLDAFITIKNNIDNPQVMKNEKMKKFCERMCLVMVGPDASKVSDDPEGAAVLKELIDKIANIPDKHADSVALINLPLEVRYENALMVNALQRISSIIVQNSIKEGFGLTMTEGLWKQIPCIGSSAVGIKRQILDGVNGLLIEDPTDYKCVASRLLEMISLPEDIREKLTQNAKLHVLKNFLIYKQMLSYLKCAQEISTYLQPQKTSGIEFTSDVKMAETI